MQVISLVSCNVNRTELGPKLNQAPNFVWEVSKMRGFINPKKKNHNQTKGSINPQKKKN
jgi:hypothetical protein